jgi:osmotically-inducible protein OsmY
MLSALAFSTLLLTAADSQAHDFWLSTKARISLATHEVESKSIHVDTQHGVITLFGTVPTMEDKQKATTLLAEIKGISRVENQLQIIAKKVEKVVAAVDEVLAKDIRDAFAKEPTLEGSKIKLQGVSAGIAQLEGSAIDIAEHATAVELAQNVPGVRRVETRVEVKNDAPVTTFYYPTESKTLLSPRLRDQWITLQVKEKFLANPAVPVFDVRIDTKRAEVCLYGTVATTLAKAEAEKDARSVAGVKNVENLIHVDAEKAPNAPIAKVSDKALEADVKKLLAREKAPKLGVKVMNGTVNLSGTVETEAQRTYLGYITRSATRAKAVKNEIAVAKP